MVNRNMSFKTGVYSRNSTIVNGCTPEGWGKYGSICGIDNKLYPETLEAEDFLWEDDYRIAETFDKPRDALDFAKEKHAVVYTEVDGDDGKRYLERGLHRVNRTGMFEVIKK